MLHQEHQTLLRTLKEHKEINIRKAVWFSRHEPTKEQLQDALEMGYEVVGVDKGRELGSREINSRDDLDLICRELEGFILDEGASAVFGVFPVPILERALSVNNLGMAMFSAWNRKRSKEGSAPTFEHFVWCQVGWI
jgi:hypothetical protein